MKTQILSIILLLTYFISFSQEKPETIELISGRFFEKQWVEVGNIKNIDVSLFQRTNLETKEVYNTVALTYTSPSSSIYTSGKRFSSTIELDEIDSFYEALNYFESNYYNKVADNTTQLTYQCKGGFTVTFYATKGTSDWRVSLQFDKDFQDGTTTISYNSFKLFAELLARAKIMSQN